ncbi:MAG TPA: hypothetical protein VF012_10255 [Nocardioidaceae bacterium]|nr:hypothetical protein [Nocardioidaceae bacterium]
MFLSRHMPCEECGESVDRSAATSHVCNPERLLDYRMFRMRDEINRFESRFHEFLSDSRGRFEAWLAARDVRRTL